uniref:YjeF N-terminal domain-containing protein n=1 Tax=Cyprinus carpio TaxID=7962 RepID=A0A8C2FEJ0_CYPCA
MTLLIFLTYTEKDAKIFCSLLVHVGNALTNLHKCELNVEFKRQSHPCSQTIKARNHKLCSKFEVDIIKNEISIRFGLVCSYSIRMHTVSRTELKSDERVLVKGLLLFFVKVQLINEAYNLVVDAVLGPETEPLSVGEPFTGVLQTLRGLKVPIVSLDIPSGWDADESSSDGISPALLVSLMAPKRCALSFPGSHFLAGRFLPFDLQRKYELNLPKFSGTESVVQL